eukprot:TRINITY_DN70400_c0_g1_i1.p1 TRINITY_DN70400_c0_g1~~TRINITY_DN70400_c0_g1_i1.p1  ORF type:complete len:119 (-),score=22.39 TRINITY_DN70400_c0_g1_i1:254-610(-)
MAIPPNLVVNLTFNPPEISIVGPIREATIQKLSQLLPQVCTSSPGTRAEVRFVRNESPPHWYTKLPMQFCNEELGQPMVMLAILDALEEEGGWKLKGSNSLNHDDTQVTFKFFFCQKL